MHSPIHHSREFWLMTFIICGQLALGQEIPRTPMKIHFQPSDYDGGIQNWSFAQDSSGILYVANNDGLLEFDGANWSKRDVPYSTKLRAVYIDKRDRIFVGGQGQIGYFEKGPNGFHFISLLERLPLGEREISETWHIFEHSDQIYFNTGNRLLVLDGEDFYSLDLPYQIQRAFTCNGRLLVQFLNKGIYTHVDNRFEKIPRTEIIKGDIVASLPNEKDDLLFSNQGGVYKVIGNTVEQIQTDLSSSIVNSAIQLSTGDYAIGSQINGLYLFDKNMKLKRQLTINLGVSNQTVIMPYEDNFGNLWIGLHNGIDYLELSSPFYMVNEQVGLDGTGYAANINNNQTYLGTNHGLFTVKNGLFEIIPESVGQVNGLSTVNGDLVLNHNRGAFLVDGNQIKEFNSTGSWKYMQTSIPKRILSGNYEGMTFYDKTGSGWQSAETITGVKESSRVFEFENDSILWMTHGYKGAYLIEMDSHLKTTKKVTHFGVNDGFPSNTLINVFKINDELIFTGESGLYNFNEESRRFNKNEFLIDLIGEHHVSQMVSGFNGDIFFIEDRKLGLLTQKSIGTYERESHIFKRVNKYLSDDLENISVIDQSSILFGAKEGFIHYDPLSSFTINEDFGVIIRSIFTSSEDSSSYNEPAFFHGSDLQNGTSIKFQFASPYFDGFEDLEYSYRLLEFNNNWSEWSQSSEKEFTLLPTGEYTFQVKALNIYGLESNVSQIKFNILGPWYLTNFAIFMYIIAAIMAFTLIPFIQRKRHKTETEQLNQSKVEAIKKSQSEIDQLKNEKLKSEIKYKNNELASITMHLLDKNQFMIDIRKRMDDLTLISPETKQEMKKILKTIDNNLDKDGSWDQFAFHFDQVHGDFLKKLKESDKKLTPQETKLAAYLRMNMSSKEIADLMHISVRGVELARYRLRKKLGLNRDDNLVEYLLAIE